MAEIANRRANKLIRELTTVQNDLSIAQGKLSKEFLKYNLKI